MLINSSRLSDQLAQFDGRHSIMNHQGVLLALGSGDGPMRVADIQEKLGGLKGDPEQARQIAQVLVALGRDRIVECNSQQLYRITHHGRKALVAQRAVLGAQ